MSDNEYDIIINIDSIRFLGDKGWKIKYIGDEKRKNEIKRVIQKSKRNIVSVLGNSNRGKTYILQRISGIKLRSGYQNQTKGLSIKIPDNSLTILVDTAGTNAPLLLDENDTKPKSQKEIDYINLCQILTNYIIQTFVINQADTLICVINQLTASEQQFLNKIKMHCKKQNKRLIVIHNLIDLSNREEIEEYINNTFLKDMLNKYTSKYIPEPGKKVTNNFHKFFIENEEESKEVEESFDVRHFIFGNDESEEIKCYNNSTIAYIRDYIDTRVIRETKIIDTLIEHINTISTSVLKNELKITNENLKVIKCNEEIEPKEIIADELDNITFIGKDYEPSYRYYKMDNQFIIEIDICSKLKENSLKVKHRRDKDSKEYEKFKISGERLISGKKKNEDVKVIYNFINKRENLKKFNLNFKVKLNDFDLRFLPSEYVEEIKFGILFIYFKI